MTTTEKSRADVLTEITERMQALTALKKRADSMPIMNEWQWLNSLRNRLLAASPVAHRAAAPTGYCERAGGCVCGGDLPRVREGCAEWVKTEAQVTAAPADERAAFREALALVGRGEGESSVELATIWSAGIQLAEARAASATETGAEEDDEPSCFGWVQHNPARPDTPHFILNPAGPGITHDRVEVYTRSPAMAAEAVAWAAVHFGGERDGKVYATCDTKAEVDQYIARVHQSSDATTLTARQIAFADAAPQPAQADAPVEARELPMLRNAFRVTEVSGDPDPAKQSFAMRFSFPSIEALHAADDEWNKFTALAQADARKGLTERQRTDLLLVADDMSVSGDAKLADALRTLLAAHPGQPKPRAEVTTASRTYPDGLTDDLRHVLGFPNFRCAPYAHLMVAAGADIKPKAEDEQAHVLHWLVKLVLDHGERWADVAEEEMNSMREKVRAARAGDVS